MNAVIRIIGEDGTATDHPTVAVSKAALTDLVVTLRMAYARRLGRMVYGYAVYL